MVCYYRCDCFFCPFFGNQAYKCRKRMPASGHWSQFPLFVISRNRKFKGYHSNIKVFLALCPGTVLKNWPKRPFKKYAFENFQHLCQVLKACALFVKDIDSSLLRTRFNTDRGSTYGELAKETSSPLITNQCLPKIVCVTTSFRFLQIYLSQLFQLR